VNAYPRNRAKVLYPYNLGANKAAWMTASNLAYLRENWATESASAIACALGTSKNAIVGKAHVMHLPAKPQPGGHRKSAVPPPQPELSRPAWSYPDTETAALIREIQAERETAGLPPVVIVTAPNLVVAIEAPPRAIGKGRLGSNNAAWMTPKNLDYVRASWGSVSSANMARALGVSKFSVVTKAHRMGLPKLPNPVQQDRQTLTPAVPLRKPLAAEQQVRDAPKPVILAPPPRVSLPPVLSRRGELCSWPIGEPKRPGFRYCDDPAVEGRPYCPTHCSIGFVARKHDVGGVASREAG
jgi:GcrA cell cycle regulator